MHKMSCFIKGTLVGFAVGAAVGVMTILYPTENVAKFQKRLRVFLGISVLLWII